MGSVIARIAYSVEMSLGAVWIGRRARNPPLTLQVLNLSAPDRSHESR
jgi:hypothetical protein